MILTDYYRFEKLSDQKSKLRIDGIASTRSYNPLEALRDKHGDLFVYIGDNTYTKAGEKRKADLAISKNKHISSIYNPDINLPFWYGDMIGTSDAFLFMHYNFKIVEGRVQESSIVEIFIARGQRSNRTQLYNLLTDNQLNDEMNTLRMQAATKKNK